MDTGGVILNAHPVSYFQALRLLAAEMMRKEYIFFFAYFYKWKEQQLAPNLKEMI